MCEIILYLAGALICALLLWVVILDGKVCDYESRSWGDE